MRRYNGSTLTIMKCCSHHLCTTRVGIMHQSNPPTTTIAKHDFTSNKVVCIHMCNKGRQGGNSLQAGARLEGRLYILNHMHGVWQNVYNTYSIE